MAGVADEPPTQLGLQVMFPVPTQRQGLWLEPQTRLSDLLRAGAEPADQAEETAVSGKARTACCAENDQRHVVDGFYARSTRRWS